MRKTNKKNLVLCFGFDLTLAKTNSASGKLASELRRVGVLQEV